MLQNFKQSVLLIGLILIVSACNSATTPSSAIPNRNDLLSDPVAKGNGVWNYSVATDYYYGTKTPAAESPSLYYDLKVAYNTSTIQFVFPQFPTLDIPSSGFNPSASGAFTDVCPSSGKASSTQIMNYYALPQLTENSVTGVSTYLGPCVNGESVTAYYSSFISHVVPVIDITQEFNQALKATTSQTVIATADNVAAMINNDPNTYGVAFDNEPAINKDGLDKAPNPLDYPLEQEFYGEIAYKLAEHKKYLFLFDAPHTANYLYNNGYNHQNLNNIILFQYLYDLDTTNDATPAGPVSIESYTILVNKAATNALSSGNSSEPPLRFVLPASATSTMWDYAQGYDMVSAATKNIAESVYVNQTTLSNPSICESADATTALTIDNDVLSVFLCNSSNICHGAEGYNPSATIDSFLNIQNCVNYKNVTPLITYFNISTASVSASLQSNGSNNPRYLGVDLYAWQIEPFAEINAAKGYFNVLQTSTLYKQNTQVFPSEITSMVWESFISWDQDLFN